MERGIKWYKRLYIILGVMALSSFLISFFTSQYNVRKNSNSAGAANLSATLTTQADWAQGELTNIDTSDNSISISDKTISWDSTTLGNLGSIDYGISSLDLGDGRGDGNNKLYFAAIDSNKIGEVWYSEGSWNSQIFAAAGSYRWYVDAKTPGKVYSGGMMGAVKHEYISGNWQNTLLASTWTPDYSGDLFVNGDDVYFVSGRDLTLEGREYKLWKNNTAIWSLAAPDASSNRIMIAGGDGRNDGTTRMYVYTQEGDIYEFSPDGSSWTANNIYDGNIIAGTLQIYLGDGRNDGINRLYFHDSSSTQLKEFSYSDGNWINTATITATHTIEKIAFGDGRNDGTNRIYYSSGSTLYEISYFPFVDGNWFERTVGSDSGASFKEIVIGDGRNDGTNRIYVANYNEDTIDEFTYTGENPAIHISASSQIDGGNEFANWGSFTSSQTVPANTSLTFRFRTSIDSINWTSWTDAQNYSDTGIDISSLVTSEQDGSYYRYLQVESTLYSIDGVATPILSDYTVNYSTTDSTCSDTIQNGDETGVDCGGSCPACPTCNDGIQNGDEEGIDCGGSCDPCPPEETCFDGILNQDEEGIDCGGVCDPCPVTPTCNDGIQNGDEEGIDCGGSCPACEIPQEEPTDPDPVITEPDPIITNPDPICPLPQNYLCDKVLCKNSITIVTPTKDSLFNLGDNVEISWFNNSSAVSLVEGWNIRYRLGISYDNGNTYTTITSGIKDINFPNQTTWQEIFKDNNWQSKLRNNTYTFTLPNNADIATTDAKIKVTSYRTNANPYGCNGGTVAISPSFTINCSEVQTQCNIERFVFTSPINIVSAEGNENINVSQDAQGNNMIWQYYYYLSSKELTSWPHISLRFLLKDLTSNTVVDSSKLTLSTSNIGTINKDGYLMLSDKYPNPTNFEISYYDQECGKTISLKVIASTVTEVGKLDIMIPNGGEFWLLGKEKSIEWSNTYKQSIIDQVTLELSLDSGKTWSWDIASDKELYQNDTHDNTPLFIKVDTLSNENSYIWNIPIEETLLTKQARVKITAYDRDGRYITSDTSDNDFEISNSTIAALLDKISNNVNIINVYSAIIALIAATLATIIPVLQNLASVTSFREFIYGIILAGRRKKSKWGVVYDAYNSTPIPYAIVMLHDGITQRLIETTSTDINGLYGFIAKKGKYFIRVKKDGYELSSANIMSRQELAYGNNYFGGDIVVNEEEQLMSANIPLTLSYSFDRIVKKVNIFTAIHKALLILNWPLILVGTFVSITALYYYPNTINIIIMILYVPIWIMQFNANSGKKAFGLVLDKAMEKPIDLALVRLFDNQTNHLVHTVASDMKGRYSMLVKNGKYQIKCQKIGFAMKQAINKEIKKGMVVLSDTIEMEKVETSDNNFIKIEL